jgi:hypothetical protein
MGLLFFYKKKKGGPLFFSTGWAPDFCVSLNLTNAETRAAVAQPPSIVLSRRSARNGERERKRRKGKIERK